MLLRWIRAITAVTGSCQRSVTAASARSRIPEMMNTAARSRRLIRDLAAVFIISGILLLADAAVTLLWQEPVTAVIALIQRSSIDRRLLSYQTAPLTVSDHRRLSLLGS